MKFYDRKREIAALTEIEAASRKSAQFTVITGRRRIGKTSLVRKAYEGRAYLHFIASRKAEADLCESFRNEIAESSAFRFSGKSGASRTSSGSSWNTPTSIP